MKITNLTLRALFFAGFTFVLITSCNKITETDTKPVYKLTTSVSPAEAGVISPSQGSFDEGAQINLQATANDGWIFTGWEGDVLSTANPANLTIIKDSNVIGTFEKRTYPLTVEIVGEGSVTESIIQGKTTDYESGTLVELEATADEGWEFTGWEGDVESNESVVEILMDGNKSVTANFAAAASNCRIVEGTVYISTTSLPDGVVGTEYSERIFASGGDGNYLWEIAPEDLPDGLSLDASTGEISGEPTLDGLFDFAAKVSCAGQTDTKDLSITIVPATVTTFRNAVINVDLMDMVNGEVYGGDEVYVGDDGILSSKGGAFWNPGASGVDNQIIGAMDEFGEPTFIEMTADFIGDIFIGAANNELQDTGLNSGGIAENAVEWRGLLPDSVYDLAVYVYQEDSIGKMTTLNVTHAGGTITLNTTANTTFILPGDINQDYFLLEELLPYEISEGVYGFLIDNLSEEGAILGLQLKGLVPAPEE